MFDQQFRFAVPFLVTVVCLSGSCGLGSAGEYVAVPGPDNRQPVAEIMMPAELLKAAEEIHVEPAGPNSTWVYDTGTLNHRRAMVYYALAYTADSSINMNMLELVCPSGPEGEFEDEITRIIDDLDGATLRVTRRFDETDNYAIGWSSELSRQEMADLADYILVKHSKAVWWIQLSYKVYPAADL